MGVGDYELYGPSHFERWERDTGIRIERDDILVIHTGYHRYYPENWVERKEVDETRYFIRHPGAHSGARRVGPGPGHSVVGPSTLEARTIP